jgi:hypothetical protein
VPRALSPDPCPGGVDRLLTLFYYPNNVSYTDP